MSFLETLQDKAATFRQPPDWTDRLEWPRSGLERYLAPLEALERAQNADSRTAAALAMLKSELASSATFCSHLTGKD